MRADPKPIGYVTLDIGQGAVIGVADTNRPKLSNFLKVERRQPRIVKPEAIGFARVTANRFGKLTVTLPKSTVR